MDQPKPSRRRTARLTREERKKVRRAMRLVEQDVRNIRFYTAAYPDEFPPEMRITFCDPVEHRLALSRKVLGL